MQETNGNGIGRLVEATGATSMVNNSFSLLRCGVCRKESMNSDNVFLERGNILGRKSYCNIIIFIGVFRKGGKMVLIGLMKVSY